MDITEEQLSDLAEVIIEQMEGFLEIAEEWNTDKDTLIHPAISE